MKYTLTHHQDLNMNKDSGIRLSELGEAAILGSLSD